MWTVALVCFRLLAGAVGLALLCLAFLLREDEEGRLRSRLEDMWIVIDDYQKTALSKQVLFMREVAGTAGRFLEVLFGHRFFSAQAAGVSLFYGLASLQFSGLLFYSVGGYVGIDVDPLDMFDDDMALGVYFVALLYLFIGSLPLLFGRRVWLTAWVVLLAFIGAGGAVGAYIMFREVEDELPGISPGLLAVLAVCCMFAAISVGVLFDMAFVALTRLLLRWGGEMESLLKITTAIGLNVSVAVGFFCGPILVSELMSSVLPPFGEGPPVSQGLSFVSLVLAYVGMSNFMLALSALSFVFVAFLLLAHRLLWPLLNRSLYASQRFNLLQNRLLVACVGLALLGFAAGYKVLPFLVERLTQR